MKELFIPQLCPSLLELAWVESKCCGSSGPEKAPQNWLVPLCPWYKSTSRINTIPPDKRWMEVKLFFSPLLRRDSCITIFWSQNKGPILYQWIRGFSLNDFELAVAQVQLGYFIIWHKNTLQYRNRALDLLLKDPEIFSFWGAGSKVFHQLSPVFQQNSYGGFISY